MAWGRRGVTAVLAVGVLGAGAPAALAETTIGETGNYPGTFCSETVVVVEPSYVVPAGGGTIVSFAFETSAATAGDQLDFLVLRPTGTANTYEVIGKSGPVTLPGTNGVAWFPTAPIPVQEGDVLGFYAITFLDGCMHFGDGYAFGRSNSDPPVGTMVTTEPISLQYSANEAASLVPAPPCSRTISGWYGSAVTVRSGEVVCFENATVGGSVTVQPGGSVRATGSTFNGSITSTGAQQFRLCGSTVAGTVKVQSSTGPVQIGDDDANCAPNTLRSGLTVSGNTGGYEVTGNQITGTTTIANNTSETGEESEVKNNRMSSSLNCSGNTPPPTGGGNTTSGAKTGQCALL